MSQTFPVVGIGASAGGVDALEQLFSCLPEDPGMAFVVVQHLSPHYESLMPQILQRHTKMRVESAKNDSAIQSNHIYVLPAGKNITIADRRLKLDQRHTGATSHSVIDVFFNSLANDLGEAAIGIILSGTGTDGTLGAIDIHTAGGVVIAQSETSAKFNGMPLAVINAGIADIVEPVEKIPDVLAQIAKGELEALQRQRLTPAEEEGLELTRILAQLKRRFLVDFTTYDRDLIRWKLDQRRIATQSARLADYAKLIVNSDNERLKLFQSLTDYPAHRLCQLEDEELLLNVVIPEIVSRNLDTGSVRIWVTPVGRGEDAYSLAILMDQYLTRQNLELEIKIFATDANPAAVDLAGKAVFQKDDLANVPQSVIDRYFREKMDGLHVCQHIRKQVVFAVHNLFQDAPFTSLDLISCPGLLPVLKSPTQRQLLSIFNFALQVSGVLRLGSQENTGSLANEYEIIDPDFSQYRKVRGVKTSEFRQQMPIVASRANRYDDQQLSWFLETCNLLLDRFLPPSILVSPNGQIVHVFSGATQFLTVGVGRPSINVHHMLPDPLRIAVANGIKRAEATRDTIVYTGLQCELDGQLRVLRASVHPLPVTEDGSVHFLISFEDTETKLEPTPTAQIDSSQLDTERIRILEDELRDTRESLHHSIQELKVANQEMQSTNEELIASNEELQSTNEELHSVNEELYTVNAEHQRKIVELTELTDDIENLLDSIRVDTIYLDRELNIRRFTLGIAKTFRLLPQDIGRPIHTFNHDLQYTNLLSDIQQVLKSETALEREVQDQAATWYLMRILPYMSRGIINGVLLTLIDINTMKATEKKLAELSEIVEFSDDAIFRVDRDGMIRTWNQGAQRIYGYHANEICGQHVGRLIHDRKDLNTLTSELDRVTSERVLDHVPMRHVRKNGQLVDVSLTISPMIDMRGRANGISIVLRDISLEIRAQKDIQLAVKRRDEFLALLSHELRNPLAAILNAYSLLKQPDLDEESAAEARDVAETQLNHLVLLLDDLLDVSRITNEKLVLDLSALDLKEIIQDALHSVRHQIDEKQQTITIHSVADEIYINGDVRRLQQMVVNLLVNACKYTPPGGKIHLELNRDGEEAVLTVEDNGIGIPANLIDSVFELFVQAEQPLDRSGGGMGLGLPLVKLITDAHQGRVTVHSDGPDMGSCFTVRLPRISEKPKDIERATPPPKTDFKLLIVEDNQGIRQLLVRSLELMGVQVAAASDATTGLLQLEESQPDIAVIDIGLPDIDGYEMARAIRDRNDFETLLVAVTGYGRQEDKARAEDAGFDLHLVKPINPTELLKQITELYLKKHG